jgi:hypothetical protein
MSKQSRISKPTIERIEVTIVGTKPLVTVPLGVFKDQPEGATAQLEQALELYRIPDGGHGFPAGGIKRALLAGMPDDKEAKTRIATAVIMGDPIKNLVPLEGEPGEEEFEFAFKRPKREVSRTLPVFKKWSSTFEMHFDSNVVKTREILEALGRGGASVGIGHDRPNYGTFAVAKPTLGKKRSSSKKAA